MAKTRNPLIAYLFNVSLKVSGIVSGKHKSLSFSGEPLQNTL